MARIDLIACLVAAGLVVTGCLGQSGRGSPAPDRAETPPELPPGCEAGRSAGTSLDGVTDAGSTNATFYACFMRTGSGSGWEPTLGITRSGTVFVYRDFHPGSASTTSGSAVRFTADQGRTWQRATPSVSGVSVHAASIDPFMYVDPITSRIFVDDLVTLNCSLFSFSDDDGKTWRHSASGCLATDHQTVFAGKPRGSSPFGYPNVVYRCAIGLGALAGTSFSTACQKSLDGGLTFLPPGTPVFAADPRQTGHGGVPGRCDGATGHGVVDASGRVWVPKGFCGQPWIAFSDDEGLTWTRVQVATNGMNSQLSPDLKETYQGHEAAVGVDPAGKAYYMWVAADRLPYLATSGDGGLTWSAPVPVAGPEVNEASLPALAVGGTGKVAMAFVGTTTSPGSPFTGDYAGTTWNGYLVVSYDAHATRPDFVGLSVNDEDQPLLAGECGAIRCGAMGDFIDVQIAPDGTPWAVYSDACCDGPQPENVVGRLWGGPSLWDSSNPNGPYPDP